MSETENSSTTTSLDPLATKFGQLSARAYLDQTVVSILLQGLAQLARERPAKPIDFFIAFLLENKSKYGE